MLVLTRKSNESIMIGDDIEVSVLSVAGEKVRIGIVAPSRLPIFRTEIYLEIRQDRDCGGERAEAERQHDEHLRAEVDRALRELGGESS